MRHSQGHDEIFQHDATPSDVQQNREEGGIDKVHFQVCYLIIAPGDLGKLG
jgi:hypothetical protein